jgi:capsular polysaccharide biosynthesis protein
LFLSRKSYRRNYNQDEIFDVFKKEGFIQVFLEDYDLKGQIRMISQAEMLAGPSGAAWTNLIFCTKGAKCICWMDRKLSDFSSFSNLARSVGVDLIYVTYSSEISMTAEFYAADYHLPVEKIEKALHQMLLCYS